MARLIAASVERGSGQGQRSDLGPVRSEVSGKVSMNEAKSLLRKGQDTIRGYLAAISGEVTGKVSINAATK